jgi:hypothetical protein
MFRHTASNPFMNVAMQTRIGNFMKFSSAGIIFCLIQPSACPESYYLYRYKRYEPDSFKNMFRTFYWNVAERLKLVCDTHKKNSRCNSMQSLGTWSELNHFMLDNHCVVCCLCQSTFSLRRDTGSRRNRLEGTEGTPTGICFRQMKCRGFCKPRRICS